MTTTLSGVCTCVVMSILWSGVNTQITDPDTSSLFSQDSLPTVAPTSEEWFLNTSNSYAEYWVKTVLLVPLSTNIQTYAFRNEMEMKFASVFDDALVRHDNSLQGTFSRLTRRKRAVTQGNATVQMINITRGTPPKAMAQTTLVYYLVEGDPDNNVTAAARTVGLLQLYSDMELAILLGYEVVTKAEVYLPPPPPKDKRLWIIGAVIGGLAGFLFILWLILFIYCKCTQPPKYPLTPRGTPRGGKVADLDTMEYRMKDVKGFDYARNTVGMDNQKAPDYYRRFPMGSSDLEGMYSQNDTPPPSFQQSMAGSQPGSTRSQSEPPSKPPPAPPLNGHITSTVVGETQAKPARTGSKASSRKQSVKAKVVEEDASSSLPPNESDTQESEDRKPLKKAGPRRRKTKGKAARKKSASDSGTAGDFEDVVKMSHLSDPEDDLRPPTRTTIHAVKVPETLAENVAIAKTQENIPSDREIEDTLRQKADIERWRNKQRLRDKKNASDRKMKKREKSAERARTPAESSRVPEKDHKKKKRKKRRRPDPEEKPEKPERPPVEDPRRIQPLTASMHSHPNFGRLDTDSSDPEEADPGRDGAESRAAQDKARQLVNALLDEAFAMATPGPESKNQSTYPQEPSNQRNPTPRQTSAHPPVMERGPQHTPLYVTPLQAPPQPSPAVWNPYSAGDEAASILPPGPSQMYPGMPQTAIPLQPHPHPQQAVAQPQHVSRTPSQMSQHYPPHAALSRTPSHPVASRTSSHPVVSRTPSQLSQHYPPQPLAQPVVLQPYHSLPPQPQHPAPPRAPPQMYENPAYHTDSSIPMGTHSIPRTPLVRETSDPDSAFTPYKPRPQWEDSFPRAWAGAEETLQLAGRQEKPADATNALDLSKYHAERPDKRSTYDDELDIISDAKGGGNSQPLFESIRQEIERLALRSEEHNGSLGGSSYA